MRQVHADPRRSRARGFTLLELMITLVVIAILAGIAYPSFMGSIRKGRRAEAFAALSTVQQAQERWRANNSEYASSLTSLALSSSSSTSLYAISLANTGPTGYDAVATANSGTTQAADAECGKIAVRMSGGTLTYAGTGTSGTLSYAASHPCWSR